MNVNYFAASVAGNETRVLVTLFMVPRGEVGIIVAQIGLSLAVIAPEIYGV